MDGKPGALPMASVKALLFDVFGTTVDWRSTVTKVLHEQCQKTMYVADECSMPAATRTKASEMTFEDWAAFADEWRSMYYRFTKEVAEAAVDGKADNYKGIDEHHLDSLRELLELRKLHGLWTSETIFNLSRVWHSLDPWPDTIAGLKALTDAGYKTCTLSNGSVELLTDMATYAKLDWTHLFSAEMFLSYKPHPRVYLGAAEKLGLKPHECAMVAAHLKDLDAARKLGLRTIYVARSLEEQWEANEVEASKEWVDIWVDEDEDGFLGVAKELKKRT